MGDKCRSCGGDMVRHQTVYHDQCAMEINKRLRSMDEHSKQIPKEVIDLVIFMCETWVDISDFVYRECSGDSLLHYPVIQGTSNQMKLGKIGKKKHNPENIIKGVEWIIKNINDNGELKP